MASTIQVRADGDLKTKSDALFKDLGVDTMSVIRMFLTQAVVNSRFSFEIKRTATEYNPYTPMTEGGLLEKLEVSRECAGWGKYRDTGDVASDMRAEYGL